MLVALFSFIIICGMCELALRAAHFKPGFRIQSGHFRKVDSLIIRKGFYADSSGIQRISDEAREAARRHIAEKHLPMPPPPNWHGGTYYLPYYYMELQKEHYKSTFKSFIETLDASYSDDSTFVAAVKNYVQDPINSSGFRSIEFKKYPRKTSILLLGDSYTWGHNACNITNSFADLLLAKGYAVYNTGIIATDPAQYLQIAKIFVPLLEPDFVVVNFFMGNDIQYFRRQPQPYMPVFYCTNAGNLVACPDGIYFRSAQEAYDYSLARVSIPAGPAFNRLCSHTVITTLLWNVLDRVGAVDNAEPLYDAYLQKVRAIALQHPYTNVQLKEIKSVTEQHQGRFLLVVIPSPKAKKLIVPEKGNEVFEGLGYHVPPVTKHHYKGHYNDSGHAVHADFIDSLIRTHLRQSLHSSLHQFSVISR